jgi:hypothetical protein
MLPGTADQRETALRCPNPIDLARPLKPDGAGDLNRWARQKRQPLQDRAKDKILGLQRIPSHCDIHGNEKADFMAKSATKIPPPPADTITFNSVKKKIKSALKKSSKKKRKQTPEEKAGRKRSRKDPINPGHEKQPLPSSSFYGN